MTSAVIHNICFNNRLKQRPYYKLTRRKPDLSRMHIFGSPCYAYSNIKRKLDPRCQRGIFIGYNRNSPVCKHRLVKFTNNNTNEQHTQTQTHSSSDDGTNFPPRNFIKNLKSRENPEQSNTDKQTESVSLSY